jgi:hypothetical protein
MSKSTIFEEAQAPVLTTNGRFSSSPSSSRQVHVTVPASAAYSLDKMQSISKQVLGKLGCGGCHSGFDIRFLTEMNFRFNEKLEIMEF